MLTTSLLQITFTENFCHRHGENPLSHVRPCNDAVVSVAAELLFGAGGDTPENHTGENRATML